MHISYHKSHRKVKHIHEKNTKAPQYLRRFRYSEEARDIIHKIADRTQRLAHVLLDALAVVIQIIAADRTCHATDCHADTDTLHHFHHCVFHCAFLLSAVLY